MVLNGVCGSYVSMYEMHVKHLEGAMLQYKSILVSQDRLFASALHLRLS